MLEKMTAATFSEHLNTKFHLHLPSSETLELELIGVDDLGLTDRQERFSLIFRGPIEYPLPQATYEMVHDKLETFDLFIVPISRDEDGLRYEAAFNR